MLGMMNFAGLNVFTQRNLLFSLNDNPLHGIPILLKDNIGTADLMQTTAGALALEDLRPKRDAEVVRRLRRSSAIILGKASLTEWAEYVVQLVRVVILLKSFLYKM